MFDLYLAAIAVSLMSAAACIAGTRLGRVASPRQGVLSALLSLLLMIAYIEYLWDSTWLVQLLPVSSLIILGNWLPIATAFLAGFAWRTIPGYWLRRCASAAALLVIGEYALIHPMLGSPPHCLNKWCEGVSMQTTDATCSAACAATILRAKGIPATEQEMAELCLTRLKGTNWQGLYRGLKLKTAGTDWDVEVFHGDVRTLRALAPDAVIITAMYDPSKVNDRRYVDDWGWQPNVSHSAVFFDFAIEGVVLMGDPSVGRESWAIEDLNLLWTGEAMRLVRRSTTDRPVVA
ncbi:MAG TPA: hypothetical protein VHB77_03050, partial [Planctomycetaceae bacterium]|nr:hypothetical protein [Planctomycetaceae bacterium]